MKDYQSLGHILANLRINKGLSQTDLGKLLGVDRAVVASWEAGRNSPTREVVLRIAEVASISNQDVNYLLQLAGYEGLTATDVSPSVQGHVFISQSKILEDSVEQAINTEAVREIRVQVKDIQASLEAVNRSITAKTTGGVDHDSEILAEELQNAKLALERLQSSSREITAPVMIPASADLAVTLVPSTFLERLEEYRSEETKWRSASGIFLGAILGLVGNLATGGESSAAVWIVVAILSSMTVVTGLSAVSYRKRSDKLKSQLLARVPAPDSQSAVVQASPALNP